MSGNDLAGRDPWFWLRWAIAQAIAHELKPTPAHVLLALATFADLRTGRCEPGLARLADAVVRRERETTRALTTLSNLGLIERRSRGPGRTFATRLIDRPVEVGCAAGCGSRATATQHEHDSRLVAVETRGRPQSRLAVHRGQNSQGNNQLNCESPSSPTRRTAAPKDKDFHPPPLVLRICSTLQGGVDELGENDFNRRWPDPRPAVIAKSLDRLKPPSDLALEVAREAREIVQSQERAPNISSLFILKLEKRIAEQRADARGSVHESRDPAVVVGRSA